MVTECRYRLNDIHKAIVGNSNLLLLNPRNGYGLNDAYSKINK
jgi:hypothetical protein